jgi:HD superfamily phosphodiesterase
VSRPRPWSCAVPSPDADLVTAATWLHDIGYAPSVAATGFHPLGGARHLRDNEGADVMLCRLVAQNACAISEAIERGLARELATEFRPARLLPR